MPLDSQRFSRRGFLVVVGGASSALVFNSRVYANETSSNDELGTETSEPSLPSIGESESDQPDTNDRGDTGELANLSITHVESGFVDATNWQDELLTLRQGPQGMLVRYEMAARDHLVTVPEGFTGRCLGTHENLLVIGGHRLLQTETATFEAGTSYKTLLEQAGADSKILLDQGEKPSVRPYQHIFIERLPSLIVSEDLQNWETLDLPLRVGTGGSFGAVLERGSVLAADHYSIAEMPDSVIEVSQISLAEAIYGRPTTVRDSIPLDHGTLWGASDTGTSDLLIVTDRNNIKGYDDQNQVLLSLDPDTRLLGITASGDIIEAAVETATGTRQIQRFKNGALAEIAALTANDSITHRISPDILITAPDGKNALLPSRPPRTPKPPRQP